MVGSMQGYTTPEQKDTFNLMCFNSSSTPSTATNIDLGSLPVSSPYPYIMSRICPDHHHLSVLLRMPHTVLQVHLNCRLLKLE